MTPSTAVASELYAKLENMAWRSNKAGPSRLPSSARFEYDVFLSFRGEDTRNNFTGLFHHILELQDIHAFFDEEDLHKGERIEEILEAISRSKILVPIFSQSFAESKWCLREVAKMVECHGGEPGRMIIPIFFDIDPKDVRYQSGPFKAAFEKHQMESTDGLSVVEGWKHALRYVGGISGYHLKSYKGNQRDLVVSVTAEIQKVLATKSLLREEELLVGLDIRVENMMMLLDFQANDVQIVGIHGIGGIGKTTLAKAIYNRSRHLFHASCFIENVREVSKSKGLVHLQQQLIQDISNDKHKKEINSLSQGAQMVKRIVGRKSMLLVLDDVDDEEQLDALAGNRRWFHPGSRIIITTRQEKILQGLQEEAVYMLEELDEKAALQLFKRHAFGDYAPPEEYISLSKEVVSISNGIPLILQAFGSLFQTAKAPEEWKTLLKELTIRQHTKVHEQLKICYDSLNDAEKIIFLDIACLLVGKSTKDAIYMWEDRKLSPLQVIKSLEDKSLIKTDKGKFEMHDQIRDMGREVVMRENLLHPGNRSRLWYEGDVMEALTKSQANMIEGIILNLNEESETQLSTEAFELMSELRILIINCAIFGDCDFRHFPASLKWLEWNRCPLETLPLESKFKSIVFLNLSRSSISQLWSETTIGSSSTKELFGGLKVLDLSYCHCLAATPNFAMAPNLENLTLDKCISLKEVDDSIGSLKKLVFLSMRECVSLEKLPNKIYELSSLVVFNLEGCSRLVALPRFFEGSKSVVETDPDGTELTFLETSTSSMVNTSSGTTNSTSRLSNLEELILQGCESLEFLPQLHEFQSLRRLHIDGCHRLDHISKHLFEGVAFKGWDELIISGTSRKPQKQEFSFMLPYGYLTDPLLLQQLQCYGYGDPSQNGTLILRVRHEDMTNGRVLLETRHKVLCGNSIYKDGVYVHCYKINFGRNDKINEAPRSKTIIMKVTAANNSDLTQVNAKLRTRSKFSGENMEPISSKSRSKAFLSPSTSVQPSSPRKPEHELSIIFNLREDDKLDVIEYSTGLDERMDDMKSQLEAECIDQMLLFGWTIEEFIILIFSDLNISWYEQGQGTGLPQQANDKVFDNMKVLDLSYCKFLVKTPDLARIQNLEELILDHCECLLEIAESIGQLKHLILLSIVGCENLGTLPYGILQLNCLQLLNLKGCSKIKILPEASMMDVGLESLQQLILDNCTSLMEIPYYGGGLKCLRSLSLKGCSSLGRLPFPNGIVVVLEELILDNCTTLKEIPNNVEGLKCLRSLSLKGCSSLQRLPRSIGSLVVLKELILDHCKCLLEVSESIGQLNNLTLLSMVGCENLGALPYRILQLNCLQLLNLEGCSKIKILPEASMTDVGLESLQRLILDNCTSLTKIPDYVGGLKCLRSLSLKGCSSLERLPFSIGSLVVLEELILDNCTTLKEIQNNVGGLKCLCRLSLEGCSSLQRLRLDYCTSLTEISDYVGGLKCLRSLSLKGCSSLQRLPRSIGSLVVLKELILDHCKCLLEVSESIGQLNNLTLLSMVGCENLGALPYGILQLNCLELLNLEGCSKIKILPEARMMDVGLDTLKVLILDAFTSLKRLPDYVGRFRSLHCLRDCCSLYRLPISITSLEILQELKLDNCTSLTEIPHYVGKLQSLRYLSLRGCHSLERLPDSGVACGRVHKAQPHP